MPAASAQPPINLSRILRDVVSIGAQWVRVRVDRTGGFSMPASDDVTVHFVIWGTLQLTVANGEPTEIGAGGCALLPQGIPHVARIGSGPIEPLRYFDEIEDHDILPTVDVGEIRGIPTAVILIGRLRVDWPASIPPLRMLPGIMLGTRAHQTDPAAATNASRALHHTSREPGASISLTRYAELLLVRELRDFFVAHPGLLNPGDADAAAVAQAMEAVRTDPGRPWSVERLARHVGMSRSGFAAKFRAIREETPMDSVARLRMDLAARLLGEGRMKAKEIAARVGYSSDAAFVRSFTRHFGLSPTNYRKKLREEASVTEADWLQPG
ncbi:AraC family transcriptional regulator [Sphingomonas montanisoli]|nr:AraC family transcriptional regulator [Sphingomonas montanisoli]